MNLLIYSIADGTMFFVGTAMVVLAAGLLLWVEEGIARSVQTVAGLAGFILVVLSATPFPLWVYFLWTLLLITTLILTYFGSSTKGRLCVFIPLVCVTMGMWLAELPYHRTPEIRVADGTTVYVLGDSISAGMGMGERPWPVVMDDLSSIRVINLARAGATTESVMAQVGGITQRNSFVIVEIGGNDLLGWVDAVTFRNQLHALISTLQREEHQILMFELPLFPFKNAFGRAQREIAREFEVPLLPKRRFAQILASEGGTVDGIHLSQDGHDAMANIVASVITVK